MPEALRVADVRSISSTRDAGFLDFFSACGCASPRKSRKPHKFEDAPEWMNEETLLGVPVKLAQKGFQGTVDGVAVVDGHDQQTKSKRVLSHVPSGRCFQK